MSHQRYYTVSMECNVILSVQPRELLEVAELCWDGAIEFIREEAPERATMTQ